MTNKYLLIALIFSLTSCIPLRVAPEIENYKLVSARKFKRDLPKNYGFVFEDPKDADEFYEFINAKYDLGFVDVESNVPFQIKEKNFFLSFYEREKINKTLNLIPIFIDVKLASTDNDPVLDDKYTTRKGKWYLVLIVTDVNTNDVLDPSHKDYRMAVHYLNNLKEEYLTTHNYIETQLMRAED